MSESRGDTARRLRRSQKYLQMWALTDRSTSELPALDDSATVVRSGPEIAGRTLALTLVALKGQGLSQAEVFAFADGYGVWPVITVEENEFLLDPDPSHHDLVQAAWRFEGVRVLLWSLGLERHLGFPDRVADSAAAVHSVITAIASKAPPDRPERRPLGEILDAADIARRLAHIASEARARGEAPPSGMNYGVVHEREIAFGWLVAELPDLG